jgi:hypothetical protein
MVFFILAFAEERNPFLGSGIVAEERNPFLGSGIVAEERKTFLDYRCTEDLNEGRCLSHEYP